MDKKYTQTALSQLLNRLFAEFEKMHHPYCVCGNYHALPYYTDNDVDIWTAQPEKLTKIIENICADLNYKLYLKNKIATGSGLFFYAQNCKPRDLIHFDILSECRWSSILPLVKSHVIEKHCKIYNGFYVADEIVDAAMHLMYPLTHFGKIPEKYKIDITVAARDNRFWNIVKEGWGDSFSNKIMPLVVQADWLSVEKEFENSKRRLFWRLIRRIDKSELPYIYRFVYYNLSRLLKPTGLFIAFVGPDGCGKTTVQDKLTPFFKKAFAKGKIKNFYWRPFLLPRIKALLGRGIKPYTPDISHLPEDRLNLRNVNLFIKSFHLLKLIYYWVDFIVGRIKYQGTWSRGGIVCFDRYWDDLLVFPERFGLHVPKWFVQFLGQFVPEPDIVFYLHAEPEVLINRKPELPFDEMDRQIEQYKKLASQKDNYERIDGNKSREDVLNSVIQTCLDKMSKRYEKK